MQQLYFNYEGERRTEYMTGMRSLLGPGQIDILDNIVRFAHTVLSSAASESPVILLSLIDSHHQYIWSSYGADNIPGRIERARSICAHALQSPDIFIVPDLRKDERFYDNDLVTSAPYASFYAGLALHSESGARIGTLSIYDPQPRPGLTDRESGMLKDLAAVAAAQINMMGRCHEAEHTHDKRMKFLSYICHEMRTPLGVLFGSLDVMSCSEHLSAQEKNLLETMQVASSSLYNLVDDFLDFSKIRHPNFSLQNKAVCYERVFQDVHRLLSHDAHKKEIDFILDIGGVENITGCGDEHRFRQIIINLVSNAIKYTEKGRIKIRAGFEQGTADAPVFICTVSDTGIGISREKINKLFQDYMQLSEDDALFRSGTGLGLSISKKLAEAMGGCLSCISTEGKGSVFILTLPHYKYDESAVQTDKAQAA